MTKRVLITGGAGFIGSQLCKYLKTFGDKYHVTILDNMSYGYKDNIFEDGKFIGDKLVIQDIRHKLDEYVEEIDIIVHLAGISCLPICQVNPVEAYDVNVLGTINLLECARKHKVQRIIFSSTSAVYENTENHKDLPLHEDVHVEPDLIYSMTKKACEDICKSYAKNYGMDIIITRFFNVFGSHQDIHRQNPPFTSYLAKELVNNQVPTLFNNDPIMRRDYIYVDDLLELLKKMIEHPDVFHADIFNVGGGTSYSVSDLYQMIVSISKKDIKPVYKDPTLYWDKYTELFNGKPLSRNRIMKEVLKTSYANTEKAQTTFSWKPTITILEGLTQVYNYALRLFQKE